MLLFLAGGVGLLAFSVLRRTGAVDHGSVDIPSPAPSPPPSSPPSAVVGVAAVTAPVAVAAAASPVAPQSWESQTEDKLRSMARRMEPDVKLESIQCKEGSCRLEISHGTSAVAGDRLNALISDAIPFLPDSTLQPEVSPGRTLLTLSRGPTYVPNAPLDKDVALQRIRIH